VSVAPNLRSKCAETTDVRLKYRMDTSKTGIIGSYWISQYTR
jgi:hypothetical protein